VRQLRTSGWQLFVHLQRKKMVAGFGKQTYYSNEQNLGEDVRATSNETLIEHLNIKNCHRSWRWLWIKTYIIYIYQFISHRYPSQSLQSKKNICKIHCTGHLLIVFGSTAKSPGWTLRTWSCWRMPIVRRGFRTTWHFRCFSVIFLGFTKI